MARSTNVERANYQLSERFESAVLKHRLFNPALIELLPKVWVRPQQKDAASALYRPEFQDVVDYVAKLNPAQYQEVQKQEIEREVQRETLRRRRESLEIKLDEIDRDLDATELGAPTESVDSRRIVCNNHVQN